jgi:hypothetical protein
MNGFCGTNDQGSGGQPGVSSKVTPCDNSVAAKNISTKGGTSGTGGGGTLCPKGGQQPNQDGGCNPSPIIVDVDGSGFHLTSAADGVVFDIFANGSPVQVAWTAPGSTNAFLVLDRNGNGAIDSGTELFGNFTPQPSSSRPNGFLALAEYDKPENGGNGDCVIDSQDAIFSQLRLWVDANHDGISQPEELHTLPEMGVFSISLNYALSMRTDEFGNVFQYHARINPGLHGPSDVGKQAYDVFFVTK